MVSRCYCCTVNVCFCGWPCCSKTLRGGCFPGVGDGGCPGVHTYPCSITVYPRLACWLGYYFPRAEQVKLRIPWLSFLLGSISDVAILGWMKFRRGRRREGRWPVSPQDIAYMGRQKCFPKLNYIWERDGARHCNSFFCVVADYKTGAIYGCHCVRTFFCSRTVASKFPEFTFTRECCQESCLIPKLKGITSWSSLFLPQRNRVGWV